MSAAADLHDLELIWPSPAPRDVIVTGTFDKWSASIRLSKGDSGFSGTVKVPWGQKVVYKYIVDGRWRCRDDQPQEDDGHGNFNNVFLTPQKPAAPSVPCLNIPADGGGEVEATMVTAVEFLPPVDLTSIKGPLPIPQLAVPGLDQAPSATPIGEANWDPATATDDAVFSASEPLEELVPAKELPSCDASPVDDTSVSPINQNGEVHDVHSLAASAPIQSTKEELVASPCVPNTTERTVSTSLESTAHDPSPLAAQDVSALIEPVQVPSASTPAAASELVANQPEAGLPGTTEESHPQETSVASATLSVPTSVVATHKKRRSLLARIKHIFDKKGRKEKTKY